MDTTESRGCDSFMIVRPALPCLSAHPCVRPSIHPSAPLSGRPPTYKLLHGLLAHMPPCKKTVDAVEVPFQLGHFGMLDVYWSILHQLHYYSVPESTTLPSVECPMSQQSSCRALQSI